MNAPVKLKTHQNDSETDLISISEIFGPTIQGEGALIGTPTIFVRTGGCDYRCHWCDTGYAVLPEYEKDWQLMDASSLFKKIEALSKKQPFWITLSGGNPATQELGQLIKQGQKKGYQFSMETQGSISKPWFSLLDQLTLSPKPPSSGMSFKQRGLDRCINASGEKTDLSLKFVIANKEDLIWAKSIADLHPHIPSFVQPCNTQAKLKTDPDTLDSEPENYDQQKQMLWLIEAVQSLNWHNVRILPQLHTWLWGNQTGV